VVFFCPACWKELPGDLNFCPHCYAQISSWSENTFVEKLLQALSHPEPLTQIRAVYVLGEKKIAEAVPALTVLFRRSKDLFLQSEIVEAMGKIGSEAAISLLLKALCHPSFIVRGEAARSLGKIPRNSVVKGALNKALKDPSSYVREIRQKALEIAGAEED